MGALTLVIGNRNYSSWSLRPWLLLREAGIPFTEIRLPLYGSDASRRLAEHSPSGKVPVLHDDDLTVWDSLAICEYLAERFPEKAMWPEEPQARATARSVSAEMHSGFLALRQHMPMNIRRSLPGRGRIAAVDTDIVRILAIWSDCRSRYGAAGPFLFGEFGVADAMYAPVALRFRTYGVVLDGTTAMYRDALLALPAMQEWCAAARLETEVIPQFEPD